MNRTTLDFIQFLKEDDNINLVLDNLKSHKFETISNDLISFQFNFKSNMVDFHSKNSGVSCKYFDFSMSFQDLEFILNDIKKEYKS